MPFKRFKNKMLMKMKDTIELHYGKFTIQHFLGLCTYDFDISLSLYLLVPELHGSAMLNDRSTP